VLVDARTGVKKDPSMTLTPPGWLAQHGSSLKLGSDGSTLFLLMAEQPNYSLKPVPVQGRFGCAIRQTNNGRPIPSGSTFPTREEALQSGLEDLGKELGWA
jgi:hypothetical protein